MGTQGTRLRGVSSALHPSSRAYVFARTFYLPKNGGGVYRCDNAATAAAMQAIAGAPPTTKNPTMDIIDAAAAACSAKSGGKATNADTMAPTPAITIRCLHTNNTRVSHHSTRVPTTDPTTNLRDPRNCAITHSTASNTRVTLHQHRSEAVRRRPRKTRRHLRRTERWQRALLPCLHACPNCIRELQTQAEPHQRSTLCKAS